MFNPKHKAEQTMKRTLYAWLLALPLLILSSCVSQQNINKNYGSFRPDQIRLEMSMADYNYLGDVTVEVEYKTYLGIFHKLLTVNGEPYNPRFVTKTNIRMNQRVSLGYMKKALYKVTDLYPNADFILPVSEQEIIEHMPMGRIKKRTMTFKVFAIANVAEKARREQLETQNQQLQQQATTLQAQIQILQQQLTQTEQQLESALRQAAANDADRNRSTNRRR